MHAEKIMHPVDLTLKEIDIPGLGLPTSRAALGQCMCLTTFFRRALVPRVYNSIPVLVNDPKIP